MVSIAAASVAQLGLLVVLGRGLDATEFGVAAALIALVSFPRMVVEAMLPAPVIQRPELSNASARTAATLALLATTVIALLMVATAGPISSLFAIDAMERWVRWLAIALPIHGLATVPQAVLQRELRFREVSAIDSLAFMGGYLVVGSVAVAMGAGVAAVVVAVIAEGVVRVLLSLIRKPVVPTLTPDRRELREMSAFAGSTGVGSVLNLLATRGDYVMVSRLLGPVSLAAYTQAYQLAYNPGLILGRVSNRWLFPVLARGQDRPKEQADTFVVNLLGLGFLMGSAAVLTSVLAPEAIHILFGSGWDDAVLPMQILAIGLPFRVMYTLCDAHAKATGQVGRRAVIQGLYAGAVVVLAAIGATVSLAWAAAGVVVAIALNYALMLRLAVTASPLRWSDLLRAHRLVPVGAAITGGALALVVPAARALGTADIVVAALAIGVTAAAMIGSVLVVASRRAAVDPVEVVPAVSDGPPALSHDRAEIESMRCAPDVEAEDTSPALSSITELLGALERNHTKAVVFKGAHRLDRALSGSGDLDLYVPAPRRERACSVLGEHGFVRVESAWWRSSPSVSDWFGVDVETAQLVHVQISSPLHLGSALGPQVVISDADRLADRADTGVAGAARVACAADAVVVRLCDAVLASRVGPGRRRADRIDEALTLAAAVPTPALVGAAAALFDESVGYAVGTAAAGGSWRELRRLLLRDHRAGRRRLSPIAWTISALARANRSTTRRSILARRKLGAAPMIAIIGSDGSGKSTVSQRLVELLDEKLDARFFYFGTGDGPASLLRRPLVALKRRWESMSSSAAPTDDEASSSEAVESGAPGTRGAPAAARILWAVVTAFERRTKLRRARRAARRGFVVVSDRFPQSEEPGIHDGPRLVGRNDLGRVGRAVARWEQRQYESMVRRGPDLVVLLDVSLDVAMERRPEETREELDRRITVARTLGFGGVDKVSVDAHAPIDTVTGLALRHVLDRLRS